jgi:NDP-sugar pyrophosphorylase family protein
MLDECGRVESFIEKSNAGGAGLINAGVYLIGRPLIRDIAPGRVLSLEKEVFPQWIGRGLFAYVSNAPTFIDIGTPQSFQRAQTLFPWSRNA